MSGCVIAGTPIAVDFWKLRKCQSVRFFFLTHLHADHCEGLTSTWKYDFYCSDVTKKLAVMRLRIPAERIHSLVLNEPYTLDINDDGSETVRVTALDSNHCPGSVMYLFQGYFGNILHTGDFRYSSAMFADTVLSQNLVIDRLYLDNTYCSPEFNFPDRNEAFMDIVNIISSCDDCDVVIAIRSLGKEDLLVRLAFYFNTWIIVPSTYYQSLQPLELPNVFTTDAARGFIRVLPFQSVILKPLQGAYVEKRTVTIVPSSLYHKSRRKSSSSVHYVSYSDHSSYKELHSFVRRLRPAKIVPIVAKIGIQKEPCDISCFDIYLKGTPLEFIIPASVQRILQGLTKKRNHGQMQMERKKRRCQPKCPRKEVAKGVHYESFGADDLECVSGRPSTNLASCSYQPEVSSVFDLSQCRYQSTCSLTGTTATRVPSSSGPADHFQQFVAVNSSRQNVMLDEAAGAVLPYVIAPIVSPPTPSSSYPAQLNMETATWSYKATNDSVARRHSHSTGITSQVNHPVIGVGIPLPNSFSLSTDCWDPVVGLPCVTEQHTQSSVSESIKKEPWPLDYAYAESSHPMASVNQFSSLLFTKTGSSARQSINSAFDLLDFPPTQPFSNDAACPSTQPFVLTEQYGLNETNSNVLHYPKNITIKQEVVSSEPDIGMKPAEHIPVALPKHSYTQLTEQSPAGQTLCSCTRSAVETPADQSQHSCTPSALETPAGQSQHSFTPSTVEAPADQFQHSCTPSTVETPADQSQHSYTPSTVETPADQSQHSCTPSAIEAPADQSQHSCTPSTVETPADQSQHSCTPSAIEAPADQSQHSCTPSTVETPADQSQHSYPRPPEQYPGSQSQQSYSSDKDHDTESPHPCSHSAEHVPSAGEVPHSQTSISTLRAINQTLSSYSPPVERSRSVHADCDEDTDDLAKRHSGYVGHDSGCGSKPELNIEKPASSLVPVSADHGMVCFMGSSDCEQQASGNGSSTETNDKSTWSLRPAKPKEQKSLSVSAGTHENSASSRKKPEHRVSMVTDGSKASHCGSLNYTSPCHKVGHERPSIRCDTEDLNRGIAVDVNKQSSESLCTRFQNCRHVSGLSNFHGVDNCTNKDHTKLIEESVRDAALNSGDQGDLQLGYDPPGPSLLLRLSHQMSGDWHSDHLVSSKRNKEEIRHKGDRDKKSPLKRSQRKRSPKRKKRRKSKTIVDDPHLQEQCDSDNGEDMDYVAGRNSRYEGHDSGCGSKSELNIEKPAFSLVPVSADHGLVCCMGSSDCEQQVFGNGSSTETNDKSTWSLKPAKPKEISHDKHCDRVVNSAGNKESRHQGDGEKKSPLKRSHRKQSHARKKTPKSETKAEDSHLQELCDSIVKNNVDGNTCRPVSGEDSGEDIEDAELAKELRKIFLTFSSKRKEPREIKVEVTVKSEPSGLEEVSEPGFFGNASYKDHDVRNTNSRRRSAKYLISFIQSPKLRNEDAASSGSHATASRLEKVLNRVLKPDPGQLLDNEQKPMKMEVPEYVDLTDVNEIVDLECERIFNTCRMKTQSPLARWASVKPRLKTKHRPSMAYAE